MLNLFKRKPKKITRDKKPQLKVSITDKAYAKICNFTSFVKGEVGGLMIIDKVKEGEYLIEDAVLLKQKVTGASVELETEAIAEYLKELSRTNPKKINKVRGWWHCITKDTPILLANGKIENAGEVYAMKNLPSIVAYNQKTNKFVVKKISAKKIEKAKNLKKVITQGNRYIECTSNHLLLTKEGWKQVKELKIGEEIATPNNYDLKSKKTISSEFAELIGWILSDGWINKDRKQLGFTNLQKKVIDHVNELYKTVFGYRLSFYKPKSEENRDMSCWIIRETKPTQVHKFLEMVGTYPIGREEKFIPNIISTQPKRIKDAFLRGLFGGDGSLDIRSQTNIYRRIYTTNKRLCNEVVYLIQGKGISQNVRCMKQKKIKGRDFNNPIIYDIYYQTTKQLSESIRWVKIKEMHDINDQEVYLFTVPKHHNYICGWNGGFVSHNSHEHMNTFWSPTDEECIKSMAEHINGLVFSLVTNKDRDIILRIDYKTKKKIKTDNNIPLIIKNNFTHECLKEIKQKVEIQTPFVSTDGYWGYDLYPEDKFMGRMGWWLVGVTVLTAVVAIMFQLFV